MQKCFHFYKKCFMINRTVILETVRNFFNLVKTIPIPQSCIVSRITKNFFNLKFNYQIRFFKLFIQIKRF